MRFLVRSIVAMFMTVLLNVSAALATPLSKPSKGSLEFGYPRVAGLTEGDSPFLIALFRAIYQPEGFGVAHRDVSFSRALQDFSEGTLDAVPMCIRYAAPKVIWSKFPISVGFGQMTFLRERFPGGIKVGALDGKSIALLTASGLDTFFPKAIPTEVRLRDQGLKMVLAGRADAFLDGIDGLQVSLRSLAPKDRARLDTFDFGEAPLYVRFQDNPKGRELAKIFDARLPKIVASGEYLKLLLRYEPFKGFSKRVTEAMINYNAAAK
jgi:polar amino acid transport system substrate-binding protein